MKQVSLRQFFRMVQADGPVEFSGVTRCCIKSKPKEEIGKLAVGLKSPSGLKN